MTGTADIGLSNSSLIVTLKRNTFLINFKNISDRIIVFQRHIFKSDVKQQYLILNAYKTILMRGYYQKKMFNSQLEYLKSINMRVQIHEILMIFGHC